MPNTSDITMYTSIKKRKSYNPVSRLIVVNVISQQSKNQISNSNNLHDNATIDISSTTQ